MTPTRRGLNRPNVRNAALDLRREFARRLDNECPAGFLFLGMLLMRVRMGSAKAAVLPVPVWADPITSRPWRTSGMACCWMGGRLGEPGGADGQLGVLGKLKICKKP